MSHVCAKCRRTTPASEMCNCKLLKLIKHHVKYEPEIIILVCEPCHEEIHGGEYDNRWVKYTAEERDEFYEFRETGKNFVDGINQNHNALSHQPGVGICMDCGKSSCSWFGCYVENHNCRNSKVSMR